MSVRVSSPPPVSDKLTITTDHHCQSQHGLSHLFCEDGETVAHVGTALSGAATAFALLFGGIWAYAKFVRGRIFKPRTSVEVTGQWYKLAPAGDVLLIRIQVTNIGGAKLTLVKADTWMEVLVPGPAQTTTLQERQSDPAWSDIRWMYVPELVGEAKHKTFAIFQNHDFIEPSESVMNDRLLNLGHGATFVRIQAQLTWVVPHWYRPRPRWWPSNWKYPTEANIADSTDQIIPPTAKLNQKDSSLEEVST